MAAQAYADGIQKQKIENFISHVSKVLLTSDCQN